MDFDWTQLFTFRTLINLIDIGIVAFVISNILRLFRNTRARQLLNGIAIIIIVKFISSFAGLHTTEFIVDFIIQWSAIALIVIFQPELRKALEHLGRNKVFDRRGKDLVSQDEKIVDEIMEAVQYMARRKIGALISIEKDLPLNEYIETGIKMDSVITSQLLINIFIPNTPLHDGAVILTGHRIASAASYLPLSENPSVPKKYGTRHRAAIGLSEHSDAVTIVVSEETGALSISNRGKLLPDLEVVDARDYLKAELLSDDDSDVTWLDKVFSRRTKGGDS
ncbi:MAG: diadenylate cyclase CdaA [Atopococcus tabaci]|uniref:Diadenylate cyclase n=1 Tax=Atopococcus tabaci TaxID=269774 RepID=A0AA43UC89_9LACT|nr:diadenylate cyclase CdaA [Atopococcus tabaci]